MSNSRRNFLWKSSLAATGITLGMPYMTPGTRVVAANETLNIGVIGTGGRGSWAVKVAQSLPNIKVIACCDILDFRLEEGLSVADPKAKGYKDYREVLDRKDIDAVIIATPLHLHHPMAVDALEAGKHIYCEKTMTYDIPQSLDLVKKVRKSDLIFQTGYQQRVNPLFFKIKQVIDNGYCGAVKHITCTWNRNGDWRKPVPDPKWEKIINWRMYREYSGGLMAELCSHQIDVVNWILEAHPLRVVGMGGIDYWKDGRETYDNVSAVFEYPDGVKAKFTALTTNAHEGFKVMFYGTKATIEVNREQGQQAFGYPEPPQGANATDVDGVSGATQREYFKQEKFPIVVEDQASDDSLPTGNAIESFADCIVHGKKPFADVAVGHQASVAVHMANKAMREGTTEAWKKEYAI